MRKQLKKKLLSLRKEFNDAFKDLRWQDVPGICKDTLQDLRHPKEIFKLAAAVVVPGGFLAYSPYRIIKYRQRRKPGNDNKPPF